MMPTEIKVKSFGSQFVSTTKELLNHPTFEGPPEETHHYPNCEICDKHPDEKKPDEKWFVGYNWGEWFSIFICEDCINKIKSALEGKDNKNSIELSDNNGC